MVANCSLSPADMETGRKKDTTAFTLCMDNKKPIIVFDMHTPGNITRALLGEPIGTTIS